MFHSQRLWVSDAESVVPGHVSVVTLWVVVGLDDDDRFSSETLHLVALAGDQLIGGLHGSLDVRGLVAVVAVIEPYDDRRV